MKIFTLERHQLIPISLEQAWDFFSNPRNLQLITPNEMKFELITDLPEESIIHEGQLIRYKIRPILNIPLNWLTKIKDVVPMQTFTDIQLEGPYRYWEHTHRFIQKENGVHMIDYVRYALPFGILGNITHTVQVKRQLEEIFDFRTLAINKYFPSK